mmetsp:Transcript_132424/g.342578  ORF Transcript_132424/g.342578 Transcript_132424/m.342578 type:complete len:360 (+) Transcript_132424:229-1308(+)
MGWLRRRRGRRRRQQGRRRGRRGDVAILRWLLLSPRFALNNWSWHASAVSPLRTAHPLRRGDSNFGTKVTRCQRRHNMMYWRVHLRPADIQEQLQCGKGIAPGRVREATALHAVRRQQAIQGAPREVIPELLPRGAEGIQQPLVRVQVARQRLACEQLEHVPPVIPTREGHPLRAGDVATQERRTREPPSQGVRVDALGRVPREVNPCSRQEPDGLLGVPFCAKVEPEVERPGAPQRAPGPAHGEAHLDWPQMVNVLPEGPVPCCARSVQLVLAQEAGELRVQRKYWAPLSRDSIEELIELSIQVPCPNIAGLPLRSLRLQRLVMPSSASIRPRGSLRPQASHVAGRRLPKQWWSPAPL